jgi:hypothetical protein
MRPSYRLVVYYLSRAKIYVEFHESYVGKIKKLQAVEKDLRHG